MRAALLIAGKDLRRRLRDRSAYILGFVAPLGLAAIFSLVFNPISDQNFSATFGVVDLDGGPVAAIFVDEVLGGFASSQEGVEVVFVDSPEEARRRVEIGGDPFAADANGLSAAFVIPTGFSAAVRNNEQTRIEVIGSRAASTSAAIATAIAQVFVDEVTSVGREVATYVAAGGTPGPDVVEAARGFPPPLQLQDLEAANRRLDATTTMTVGMAGMFLLYVAQLGVLGLIEERREGTLARLLVAPIDRVAIIAGKTIASYVLGLASMTVLVVASTWLLGADWGDPVGVAILVLAVTFAAVGIMAVVAAVSKTAEQANVFTSMVAILLAILGGAFFPVSQVGGLITKISLFTPLAWLVRGLGDMSGGGVADALPAAGVLLAFGAVFGAVAWRLLKRGLEQ